MPYREWKCTECGEAFKSGQWTGCRGMQTLEHKVESKTYYSGSSLLNVTIRPDKTLQGTSGNLVNVPGKDVQFIGGVCFTNDPETQEVLDSKSYLLSHQQYNDLNTTPELRNARLRGEIDEKNRLLDEEKAKAQVLREQLAAAQAAREPEAETVGAGRRGK